MSAGLKLVIFDVDGTLVDSQAAILGGMGAAFGAVDQPLPERATLLGVVGLSLEVIFPRLAPTLSSAEHRQMVEAYKASYMNNRARHGVAQSAPFYPGALETLQQLHAMPEVLLGVATGKSKRGLDKMIEGHGLEGMFVTQQCADFHPSKPHPAMILQALRDAGVEAQDAVMVGDTSFDMEMAAHAGVRGVGVSWGYHPADVLTQAACVIDRFDALPAALDSIWEGLV